MATRQDIIINRDTLLCPICLDTFTLPRTLPCQHSFCQLCLEEYIKVTVKTVYRKRGFGCAVCRKFTHAPARGLLLQEWAAHFPQNFTLISILDSSKSAGEEIRRGEYSCDPCRREDIEVEVEAISYCLDCEEKMCKHCQRYHRKNKATSKHVLRNIDESGEVVKVFDFIQNLTKCLKHPSKKIKYFCEDHSESCCGECTKLIHRRCEQVMSLEEKAESCVKDSAAMVDIMELMEAHAEVLLDDEQRQLKALDKARDETNAGLTKLENKMPSEFEELSRRTLEKLENEHKIVSVKKMVNVSAIEALKHRMTISREKLDSVKARGNEELMFLYVNHQLQNDLVQVSEDLHSLQKSLKREEILVDVQEDFNWVIVRRKTSESQVAQPPYYRPVRKTPQVLQPPSKRPRMEDSLGYRPGRDRNANIKHRISTQFSFITGCVWKDESKVFVCDVLATTISVYDVTTSSTECQSTFNCPSNPTSMVKLDSIQMAVSYPDIDTVQIMNLSQATPTVVREIKTRSKPQGLAYNSADKHLLIQSHDGTIRYVRLDGTDAGSLPLTGTAKHAVEHTCRIAFNSNIKVCYLACFGLHKVMAIDRKGLVVFDYSHECLKRPYAISLGPDDDIYVCSRDTDSIHQLSPSGQLLRELLTTNDGITWPRIISFSDYKHQFVVACDGNKTILVYDFV